MAILGAPSLLKVQPRYFVWFLRPRDPLSGPSNDTIVEGDVSLTLSQSKNVKRIDVELIGTQNMVIHGKYASYPTIQRKTTINPGMLGAGSHSFYFSFIVPANTAPQERLGQFQPGIPKDSIAPHGGQVRASTEHKLKVTAYGCGTFNSDLISSTEIILRALLHEDGIAQDYSRTEEFLHPILGQTRCHLFSKYLLIHGFLRVALRIPEIEEDCIVDSLSVCLDQSVRLNNLAKPGEDVEQVAPWRIVLWHSSQYKPEPKSSTIPNRETLPRHLKKGENLNIIRIMQLPTDNTLRQSTSPFSETGIQVSHSLVVIIRYTASSSSAKQEKGQEGQLKELKFRFDAPIASCDSTASNFELPGYDTATTSTLSPREVSLGAPGCLCMQSAASDKAELERMNGLEDYVEEIESLGNSVGEGRRTKWEVEEAEAE